MNDDELNEVTGYAMGWIDYPNDSVEQGDTWHTDPSKAPFDRTFPKYNWSPLRDNGDAMYLLTHLGINVQFSKHSVTAGRKGSGPHSVVINRLAGNKPEDIAPARAEALRRAVCLVAAEIWEKTNG